MSLVKSQKINLYKDEKATDKFEIVANSGDAVFSYVGKPLKFDADLQYKNGAVYVSVLNKFTQVVQSIDNEAVSRNQGDMVLQQGIDAELARATSVEQGLINSLATEVKARSDFDTNITTLLATETTARQSADSKITNDLAFEVARSTASEGVLNGLISAEQKSRQDADTKLSGDIATEIADRKSAITTEAKSRSDADAVLDGKISALGETELTHFMYLDNKIALETTRAMTAESSLSSRVDFLTTNVDSKKMDSLAEIVNKMNSVGIDVYTRLVTIEAALESLRGSPLYASTPAGSYSQDVPATL
jgi:hypothetical protein